MHELLKDVKDASRALSTHDAETLERLVMEARTHRVNPAAINVAELSRAAQVLSAQVAAASLHLHLQRRRGVRSTTYRASPWAL